MFGKHCRLVFIWPQTCASEVWTQQKAGSESLLALRVLAAPTIPLAGEPPHTHIPPDVKRANKHQRPWRAQSDPMKSSLLSRHADMKGAMSCTFPSSRLASKPKLPERHLGRFGWRLMHIFYWLVWSASDQSGPEGDDVLMCFIFRENLTRCFWLTQPPEHIVAFAQLHAGGAALRRTLCLHSGHKSIEQTFHTVSGPAKYNIKVVYRR